MNEKPEYALSIKQPWAWLICKGFKDIENRDWAIGSFAPVEWKGKLSKMVMFPKRIYVHSSKQFDRDGMAWLMSGESPLKNFTWYQTPDQFGSIIGEVDITDCVTRSDSQWFTGTYGLTLVNPIFYDKPIPCKGQLGFWKPDLKLSQEGKNV